MAGRKEEHPLARQEHQLKASALTNEVSRCEPNGVDILRGRIITGMPISAAVQKQIEECFEKRLGQRVKLISKLEKKQLAGVRVEIGGYSYDGTLQGQLKDVYKLFTQPDEEE